MATLHGIISMGMIDSTGAKASVEGLFVQLDDSATLATIMAAGQAIVAATAALSEDGLQEWTLRIRGSTTGLTTVTPDSDSEEGLGINMNQTGNPYPQEIWIPAMIDALLVNGKIDLTNALLTAWTALLAAANPLRGESKAFNVLTTLRDAAEAFRTLKRQARKKTKSIA